MFARGVIGVAVSLAVAAPASAQTIVATVAAPDGFTATISDEAVAHQAKLDKDPLHVLIHRAWIAGEASERGIVPNLDGVYDEQRRPNETRQDLVDRVRSERLEQAIKDQISQAAALTVTQPQIDDYVAKNPRTLPERRRVRLVLADNARQANRVKRALQRGLTWRTAYKRWGGSTDLIEPGTLAKRLERAIYKAPRNRLTREGAVVFKVIAIDPQHPTPLQQQKATAWEILASDAQQQAITAFEQQLPSKWRPRTRCATPHQDCAPSPSAQDGA